MNVNLAVVDLSCLVIGSGATCVDLLRCAAKKVGFAVSVEDVRSVVGLPLRRAIVAIVQTGTDLAADARRSEVIADRYAAALLAHYHRVGYPDEVLAARRSVRLLAVRRPRSARARSSAQHDEERVTSPFEPPEAPQEIRYLDRAVRLHERRDDRVRVAGDLPRRGERLRNGRGR